MPLTPLEAANRVNEQVTVEMLVKAAHEGLEEGPVELVGRGRVLPVGPGEEGLAEGGAGGVG
jgi:hypothetical protein